MRYSEIKLDKCTGNFEEHLKTNLEEYFVESPEEPDKEYNPLILESTPLTLVIWKKSGVYYIFDPKPRDDAGQVFGKDEWSAKVEEPIEITDEQDNEGGGDGGGGERGDGDKVTVISDEVVIKQEQLR